MYDMEATPTTHTHTHSPHGRLTAPALLYSQQMRGPLSECAAIFISDSGSQRSRSGGSRAWRHAPLISCCWRPKERRLTEIKPRLDVEEGSRARRLWESVCLEPGGPSASADTTLLLLRRAAKESKQTGTWTCRFHEGNRRFMDQIKFNCIDIHEKMLFLSFRF